ncbi:hypothetical protein PYCC9005_001292 [Savitreella phatthalungensis]
MRQTYRGIVVSALNAKTVKVRTTSTVKHPVVLKTYQTHKDFLCHDESDAVRPGDVVRIESCRPLSARKRFAVTEILRRSAIAPDPTLMRKQLRDLVQKEYTTTSNDKTSTTDTPTTATGTTSPS